MTQPVEDNSSFLFADPGYFQLFRDVLEKASFTDAGILETLGIKDYSSVRSNDQGILLRRTNKGTPLGTLVRLFLVNVPVDLQAARTALAPAELGMLEEAGLLRSDGNTVSATIRLFPFSVKVQPCVDLFFAHDHRSRLLGPFKHDYVMGVASSTIALANVTVRKRVGASLDIGTGCGIHALLAARHSDRVAAVDLNPRAVRLATFNAKLNRMHHVECLEGDLFEPVKDRKFDLITSNPPFVISPGVDYVYRDNALQGDRICRKIVREAGDHLNENGFCHIMCNWVEPSGGNWSDHLEEWFEGTGCDAWVMRMETREAELYASNWIRQTEFDQTRDLNKLFEEWMAYYDRQGIKAIGLGLITMRRSSGRPNWFRADESPEEINEPCGDVVEKMFELKDFLNGVLDDSKLLDTVLVISPDARLQVQYSPFSGSWTDAGSHLSLVRGLTRPGRVDPYVAKLIIGCNGQRRLVDLLSHMAESVGADPAAIAPELCGIVRRLVEQGFLLPAHMAG